MIDSVSSNGGAGPDLRTRRRKAVDNHVDRLPPHSPEAEQGVLGCCLLSPAECLNQVAIKLGGESEAFYDLRHRTIFDAMVAMSALKVPVDVVILQQWLKDEQQLENCGGIPYLNALQDGVPSAANLSYYLEIVQEKFLLRTMIQTCTGAVARIYEHEGEVNELLDELQRDILRIGDSRAAADGCSEIKILVHEAIGTVEDYYNRQGTLGGLATGFADLDRMTDGLHGGEMIVIAARPSMGKTSLAMNIAEHVVLGQKLPVGVFSLEMTAKSLVLRMLCSKARVNLRNIRDGFMSEADFPKLTKAAGVMHTAPLYIDDAPGLSIMELRARARRLKQQHGIKLFVVDFLQLLHSTTRRARENRQQEIADISSGIKALAKELDVPVIVLSQLNRELEKNTGRKPRLSDLRESGAIEQDADLVGFLYKVNDEEDHDYDGVAVNLLIAKQRNGPTGDVNLTFLKPYTRFESAAKVSDEDLPPELPLKPARSYNSPMPDP